MDPLLVCSCSLGDESYGLQGTNLPCIPVTVQSALPILPVSPSGG